MLDMTDSKTSRKISVEIEGQMISVPTDEPRLYFVATFRPDGGGLPHRIHVTSDAEFAWTFLANALVTGGYGHVVAYDISQAETEPPQRLECLGRFHFEERHKIPAKRQPEGEPTS